MEIRRVTDDGERQRAARCILEALPDWFGIPEAREEYISESRGRCSSVLISRNDRSAFCT